MTEPKIWAKEEILEMWLQARGELQGFQRHLERNAGITAAQLGMALQLADVEYNRLRDSLSASQDLADKVCPELRASFITFVSGGEATNDYLGHIDCCPKCQEAVEEACRRQESVFKSLALYLKNI